jgi:hypothetical protein
MTDEPIPSLAELIAEALAANPANPFTTSLIKIHRLLVGSGRHNEAGQLAMIFPNNERAREWLVKMQSQ